MSQIQKASWLFSPSKQASDPVLRDLTCGTGESRQHAIHGAIRDTRSFSRLLNAFTFAFFLNRGLLPPPQPKKAPSERYVASLRGRPRSGVDLPKALAELYDCISDRQVEQIDYRTGRKGIIIDNGKQMSQRAFSIWLVKYIEWITGPKIWKTLNIGSPENSFRVMLNRNRNPNREQIDAIKRAINEHFPELGGKRALAKRTRRKRAFSAKQKQQNLKIDQK